MTNQILLNNEVYHIEKKDLPCLITYGEKVGGSHFSIALIADLFLRGSKILFLTAYPMAKDDFSQQTKGEESKIAYITNTSQLNTNAQAIILESGNEELFLQTIKALKDIDERIVFIKNMEVFSPAIFDYCLKIKKIILSGNIDKCINKELISSQQYKTIIIFTKPETPLPVNPPRLEKYTGYLWSDDKEGIVMLS